MTDSVALKGEAREVALAEAQTVQAMAQDETMRGRLAELVGAVDDGGVDGEAAELLESVLELGLQTGRIRAYYGPGGEQAALTTLRRLPRGRVRYGQRTRSDVGAAGADRRSHRRSQDRSGRARRVHALDRGRRDRGHGSTRYDGSPRDERRHMRYYMACLDLRGRDCLVVGGGRVATEKVPGTARLRGRA